MARRRRESLVSFEWGEDDLTDALRQLPEETEQALSEVVRETSAQVLASAQARTPVKSGRARAGWRQVVQGLAVRIRNLVPYADQLEQGASPQAPQGIIRVEHPSGMIVIDLDVDLAGGRQELRRAALVRTARRIFEGYVHVPEQVWAGARRPERSAAAAAH